MGANMLVAVMSDCHDHVQNLSKAIAKAESLGCSELIYLGDLISPFALEELVKFSGKVYWSLSPQDKNEATQSKIRKENYPNLQVFDDVGSIEIDKKKIAFVHIPSELDKLAGSGKYDAVFYGHMHAPKVEARGKTLYANPGEIMGLEQAPSFIVYDTGKNSAKVAEI